VSFLLFRSLHRTIFEIKLLDVRWPVAPNVVAAVVEWAPRKKEK
jgi:hypothetical protein